MDVFASLHVRCVSIPTVNGCKLPCPCCSHQRQSKTQIPPTCAMAIAQLRSALLESGRRKHNTSGHLGLVLRCPVAMEKKGNPFLLVEFKGEPFPEGEKKGKKGTTAQQSIQRLNPTQSRSISGLVGLPSTLAGDAGDA